MKKNKRKHEREKVFAKLYQEITKALEEDEMGKGRYTTRSYPYNYKIEHHDGTNLVYRLTISCNKHGFGWVWDARDRVFGFKGGLTGPFSCKLTRTQNQRIADLILKREKKKQELALQKVKEKFFNVQNGLEKAKFRHDL
jgi:hypothetical protein